MKTNVYRWINSIALALSMLFFPGCLTGTDSETDTDDTTDTQYTLTTAKEGEGELDNNGGTYDSDEEVTLTATPEDGWYFSNWTGDVPDSVDATENEITITMDTDKELNAVFKANPKVLLETSMGNITIELDMTKAPVTVKNFLQYVESGFYDGVDGNGATIFHRVIAGFMIQGGGLTSSMSQKVTLDPITNESTNGLKNDKYTIAMARTNDPNSATCQFFINVENNDFLNYQNASNPGYAVFGKVVDGTDVVDAIEAVSTKTVGYYENVPASTITITKASVVE
jgi:peptidyl-prolyl cis-trans isomerase B (cyclophilin B)